MSEKHAIITGTFILSLSGFLSRLLGFYNRIFLSRTIGAKEIGIYQFVLPFYMLAFTLCCHGLETALSNVIAKHWNTAPHKSLAHFLRKCIVCAVACSAFLAGTLYIFSQFLPLFFPAEENCDTILRITALALPFVAVKSCIRGSYIGKQKPGLPAVSQLIEQMFRVGCIYILITYLQTTPDARVAAWGMVCGEAVSSFFLVICTLIGKCRSFSKEPGKTSALPPTALFSEFLSLGIPLTLQHFSLTVFGSIEAILLPLILTRYLGSHDEALTLYGILTGMTIPFLFFPATITNSLSVMLLPSIAKSYKEKKMRQIHRTISYSFHYCMIVGILASFTFLLYGSYLGELLFHNPLAGTYLRQFSCLCPLLYLCQTTGSMLHGFSRTKLTLQNNLLSIGIRILSLFLLVPTRGIEGYLLGLILGYSILLYRNIRSIHRISPIHFSPWKSILLPALCAVTAGKISLRAYTFFQSSLTELTEITKTPESLRCLALSALCYVLLLAMGLWLTGCLRKDSRNLLT